MKITVLGAAGFIGTNLLLALANNSNDEIQAMDESLSYFNNIIKSNNIHIKECNYNFNANFKKEFENQDIIYHLISTNNPTHSNIDIGKDITDNILISINILEACVFCGVRKIVFISSGGTVYGDRVNCPIKECDVTNPINTYGIQKLTIEKLLYLYNHMYGLDYSIIRLANPYGPYQRPNSRLGVVTTFAYKALCDEELTVFGDGSVIRDYIYIDDAIRGIIEIANYSGEEKVFNLGSGRGESVNQIINIIRNILNKTLKVKNIEGRAVDVPVNILDISKYKALICNTSMKTIEEGIKLTIEFLKCEMM